MESLDGDKQLNNRVNNDFDNLDVLFGTNKKKNKYRIEFKFKIVEFLREKEKVPNVNYRKK